MIQSKAKRSLAALAVLVFFPSLLGAAEVSLPLNNPGFESGSLDGWSEWHPSGQAKAVGVDGYDVWAGRYKCYFWAEGAFRQSLHQVVTGLENGRYRLTARVKVSAYAGSPAVCRLEALATGNPDQFANLQPEGQWRQVDLTVQVSSQKLDIGFYLDSPGRTSFQMDDVALFRQVEDGNSVSWNQQTATVSSPDPQAALRQYSLRTTQTLRDVPAGSKDLTVTETAGQPVVRSGSLLFDGLYALAQQEAREASVGQIRNDDYNAGNPISAPAGGFFETGKLWTYVWTRDVAYAAHLGLAQLDPVRAKNSLEFKLSARRDGTGPEIIQDTGSGGSWPVSSDRAVWLLGAWETLKYLDGDQRTAFLDRALAAVKNTVASDRVVLYDARDGLYRGEQSFLDWREQSYPSWTKNEVVHLAMAKALSTNVTHYLLLALGAKLAAERGETALAGTWQAWAAALKAAIVARFWLEGEGLFSTYTGTELDPAAVRKYDLLGISLAILSGVAPAEAAARCLQNYPSTQAGAPVLWPQQPGIGVYHNKAIWPFVTAYSLKAAKQTGNAAWIARNVQTLIRGAALNLSNLENFEYQKMDPFAPAINSRRQLWSVAGYLSMVQDIFFGLETEAQGLRFRPFLPWDLRNGLLASSTTLRLENLAFKGRRLTVEIRLPARDLSKTGALEAASVLLNGDLVSPEDWLGPDRLRDQNWLIIELRQAAGADQSVRVVADTAPAQALVAPKEPVLTSVAASGANLILQFNANGESGVVFNIYRNGQKIASRLSGPSWTDTTAVDWPEKVYFYSVEAEFAATGLVSQHCPPQGVWGTGKITEINTGDSRLVSPDNASREWNHGRFHYNDWGRPTQTLEVRGFVPERSGYFSLQLVYANAMGPVASGLTCAVKKLAVYDRTGTLVAERTAVMPHLPDWDTWSNSSLVPEVWLDKANSYRIVISDAFNMSYFQHNALFGKAGGQSGANNRLNLSGVKFLWLRL